MLDHFIRNIFEGVNKQFCMGQKWKKPIIKHGKMTKYNYIVQYPDNLTLGKKEIPDNFMGSTELNFLGSTDRSKHDEYDTH